MRIWFCEAGQCSFTTAKKYFFFTFSWHKTIFCHDKQVTPSGSWDQDFFLAGVSGIIKFKS